MTEEKRKELLARLDTTGKGRSPGLKTDDPPADYLANLEKTTKETVVLPCPAVDVPVVCEIFKAKDLEKNCRVHINIHGGGYVYPRNERDALYCAHLAAAIHGIVVDIEYTTTRTHSYPVPLEQCYEVAKWTFSNCTSWGGDPGRVSIGGYSAGGCLTAAINLRAAKEKDLGGTFQMQIMTYPVFDNSVQNKHPENLRGYLFSMLYAGGDEQVLKDPYCSPLFADDGMLVDQPKTVLVLAGLCPAVNGAVRYGERLALAGNEVTIRGFPDCHHGFLALLADRWQEAQEYIIRQLLTT